MKIKTRCSILTGLAVSLLITTITHAADKKDQPMSEEMQAVMAKVQTAATPSAGHEILKGMEGNWDVTARTWMKPGDKPEPSTGTSAVSWVLDGRFLKQEYKGDFAGQPFNGIGYDGYDNVTKEYVSTWIDSMSTGIVQGSGQYDAATKSIKQNGTFSCPIAGKKLTYRSELKMVNKDKHIFSMFVNDPNGKEFKSMELTYHRAK